MERLPRILKEDGQLVTLPRILSTYINALRNFGKKNASYLNQVSYNSFSGVYETPPGYQASVFQNLSYVLSGFKDHLDLVTAGAGAKKRFIEDFEGVLCNESLAMKTLDKDFIPGVKCVER